MTDKPAFSPAVAFPGLSPTRVAPPDKPDPGKPDTGGATLRAVALRDVAALVLTGLGVVAAAVGGFVLSTAAGFIMLGVGLFIWGLLLGLG